MVMKVTDALIARSRGNSERAIEFLVGPDAADRQLVEGLYRWSAVAGIDAAIAVAQAYHETANLTSTRWLEDRNSAGVGISADSSMQPFFISSGDEAARLHVQCLFSLVTGNLHPDVPLWPAANAWVRSVWLDLHVHDPACPVVRTVADLNRRYRDQTGDMQATWAWDDTYHSQLAAKGNAVFGSTLDQKEPQMTDSTLPVPPLEIAITPLGNANRPKLDMPSPSFITVHEVGNQSPGADEDMHRNFVHNGGGPDQVSFHFVVGPTKAIQLIPLDENAWHASDGFSGTGNRDSVAIETIQIGDFDRTLWHLAWLTSEIITNPGAFFANRPRTWDFSDLRIRQHHDWAPDGKNCPEFMRNRGLWPVLMERVDRYLARSGSARSSLPAPMVPDFMTDAELAKGIDRKLGDTTLFALRRAWTAARDTPRLQHSGPDSPELGPPIRKGESFFGEFVFRSHGKWFVLTRFGTRVRMDDLAPQLELIAA